ncbi:MAG: 50S ribosomal protein L4 [Chloroflexota bacterium]
MKFPVVDKTGSAVSEVDLPDEIFGAEVNVGLMHQAFVRQMANRRRGTHSTKTRYEIRASKSKIYRQKGTGRARHGSRNAPIFVGGGIAHGPRPRKYTQKMPKKMRRQAIRSTLSALVRDEQLILVDDLALEQPKTKLMAQMLSAVAGTDNACIVLPREAKGNEVYVSARNLPNVTVIDAQYLNIRDLLKHEKVVMPLSALDVVTGIWGAKEN